LRKVYRVEAGETNRKTSWKETDLNIPEGRAASRGRDEWEAIPVHYRVTLPFNGYIAAPVFKD
jgi:hypothetical protein